MQHNATELLPDFSSRLQHFTSHSLGNFKAKIHAKRLRLNKATQLLDLFLRSLNNLLLLKDGRYAGMRRNGSSPLEKVGRLRLDLRPERLGVNFSRRQALETDHERASQNLQELLDF